MEAPHSAIGQLGDAEDDVNRIIREIESESEHFLVQQNRQAAYVTNFPDSNGFVNINPEIRPPNFGAALSPYGAYPVASVASPPSVLSSVASPMSVLDGYSVVLDTQIKRQGAEMSNGWLPSPSSANCIAQLIITEQPVERCRFRYRAEHSPHGALRGADKRQKSCPKVKVRFYQYQIVSATLHS